MKCDLLAVTAAVSVFILKYISVVLSIGLLILRNKALFVCVIVIMRYYMYRAKARKLAKCVSNHATMKAEFDMILS